MDLTKLPILLKTKENIEFFGFSHRLELKEILFTSFYYDNPDNLNNIINNCKFDSELESKQFGTKLSGLFFSLLKRHSFWKELSFTIKNKIFMKKNLTIWESQTIQSNYINNQFFLHYFLNSGSKGLNYFVLKSAKDYLPLPLIIKKWKNDFIKEKNEVEIDILRDMAWINYDNFIIVSIGIDKELGGKTKLLNKLFFTNFETSSHKICKTPEIRFNIYENNVKYVSLIDIPDETSNDIKEKILDYSNLIIFHKKFNSGNNNEYKEILKKYKKTPKIVLLRDCLEEIELENCENDLFSNKIELKLKNFSNKNMFKTAYFSYIQRGIHEYINEKLIKCDNLTKFNKFFLKEEQQENERYNSLKKIDIIIKGFEENPEGILSINKLHGELLKAINLNDLSKADNLRNKLKEVKLNENILKLIDLLFNNNKNSTVKIFDRLTNLLKQLKNNKTSNILKLYDYSKTLKQLLKKKNNNKIDYINFINEFEIYWEDKTKSQSNYFSCLIFPNIENLEEKKKEEIKKILIKLEGFILNAIEIFQYKISPNYLSIELIWRELISLTNYQEDLFISSYNLKDKLIELGRECMLNCIPFEIIDGDLLHMPVNFLKKLFSGYNEKTLVVSITGPQSSGKSTLLNFLFGCDFSTSTGRCTKGIYGTFLKVENYNGIFDSILLLDTEGLLSSTVNIDNRENFDREMFLFCLGVSDILLINVKGDLNKPMKDILNVCINSIMHLQNGKKNFAEILLILNQNPDTSIENHLLSIDKAFDDLNQANIGVGIKFSKDNVKVMPDAFDIKSRKIEGLNNNNEITIKIPTGKFSCLSNEICQEIFKLVKRRKFDNLYKNLEERFNDMAIFWELIRKFPNLSRYKNLNYKKQEGEILKWINNINEELIKEKNNFINRFFNSFNNFEEINEVILKEENLIRKKYREFFTSKGFVDLMIDENEVKLKLYLKKHFSGIKFEVLEKEKEEQMNEDKKFGERSIKRLIVKIQKENITDQEIILDLFNKEWRKLLVDLKPKKSRIEEANNLFKINYSFYSNNTQDLPIKVLWEKELEGEGFNSSIINKWEKRILNEKNIFKYSKFIPTYVLKGDIKLMKTDATLRYFNIKKYFDYSKKKKFTGLGFANFYKAINLQYILNNISENFKRAKNFNTDKNVFQMLNDNLSKIFQVKMTFEYFKNCIDYRKNIFLWKWLSKNLSNPYDEKNVSIGLNLIGNQREGINSSRVLVKDFNRNIEKLENSQIFLKGKKMDIEANFVTVSYFLIFIVMEVINWEKIESRLNFINEDDLLKDFINEETQKLSEECLKLNIKLIKEYFNSFVFNIMKNKSKNSVNYQEKYNKFFEGENFSSYSLEQQEEESCLLNEIENSYFYYLDKKKIIPYLISSYEKFSSKKHIIIEEKIVGFNKLKEEYSHIAWLKDYSEYEVSKIFNNTEKNTHLNTLVHKEFNMLLLIKDIKEKTREIVNTYKDFNIQRLYQEIYIEVQNLIGAGNNDLQQVSYNLTYEIIGFLHYYALHLIWKYFESFNWEKLHESLRKMEKLKDSQYEFFKLMTSTNFKDRDKGNIRTFMKKLEEYLIGVVLKEEMKIFLDEEKINLTDKIKRKTIQNNLDNRFYAVASKEDKVNLMKYLTNSRQFLIEEYDHKFIEFKESLQIKLPIFHNLLINLINEIEKINLSILVHLKLAFNQENCDFEKVLEFKNINKKGKNKEDKVILGEYQDGISKVFFELLIEYIQDDSKTPYKDIIKDEFKAKLSDKFCKALTIPADLSQKSKDFFKFLKNEMGIINIIYFLTELNANEFTNEFKEKIKQQCKFNQEKVDKTFNEVKGLVCGQKCPFCYKICGEEDLNHKYHQCTYGHQIRAIGGVKLNNNEASITICEEMQDRFQINFNGNLQTWHETKEYLKKRDINPWLFDFDNNEEELDLLKEECLIPWRICGKELCVKLEMDFVEYNKNKFSSFVEKIHYIFNIDSSGNII